MAEVSPRFYEDVLGSPKHILAPMVEQSLLAFRMLSRELGSQLCYTPMWHAGIFVRDRKYRNDAIESTSTDRPLLFQFCANDPDTFAEACALAEPHCDGVDLNLGCPQVIAQRGHYGAFLMEEWDVVEKMIKTACARISKPITAKIRVYESVEKTVEYAKMLERAGAKIITVHGRKREQKGPVTGLANWDHIKAVKENVSVPVFANGNIQYLRDVERCLEYTKVDGVMTAEGALNNPALFTGRQPCVWEMADKYLDYVDQYPTPLGSVRGHLFRMWHYVLKKHLDLREPMGKARSLDDLKKVSNELKQRSQLDAQKDIDAGLDSEDPDKLPYWRCQPYVRPKQKNAEKRPLEAEPDDSEKKYRKSKKKLLREKHHEQGGKGVFPNIPKDKWPLCLVCTANPWGGKCSYKRCKACCRKVCAEQLQDCPGHRLFKSGKPRTTDHPKSADDVKLKTEIIDDCKTKGLPSDCVIPQVNEQSENT